MARQSPYSTMFMIIAQCLSHSAHSTVLIAQLVCAYTANKLAQPRKKIAQTRPQHPRVFPFLVLGKMFDRSILDQTH